MNQPHPRRPAPPFERGTWVRPTGTNHPMRHHRGIVISTDYVGQGVTDQYLIVVVFENVHPQQQKEWTFRHQELVAAPAEEIAAPHRKDMAL